MPRLTLEDVARQAGVSRSTVSRVVNGDPDVRESVRQRVLEVIESTGYMPNAAARALASQRSWTIGLVLPKSVSVFFADPYFPRLTQGIAQACNQHNYTLGLFLLTSREDEERLFPRISRPGFLDGILVQSGQIGDQLTDRLLTTRIPLITLGRPVHPGQVSYIDVDNVAASHRAVTYLLQMGYRRIGTITCPLNTTVGQDRREGYETALAEKQLQVEDVLIAEGDFTEAGGYEAMRHLLPGRPDAVFAASDLMAAGAIRAILEAGLRVPEDVAIVGFDDIPAAALAPCPLTTVRQPIAELGFRAVEALIDLIESPTRQPHRIILDTEMIVRSSCGGSLRQLKA